MTDYNEKAREWLVSVSGNIGTIKRRESLAALLRETAEEAVRENRRRLRVEGANCVCPKSAQDDHPYVNEEAVDAAWPEDAPKEGER